ncbi:MAG: ABC transporter ATP-binding protein [Acetobacteraceae bacterium]
MTSAPPRLALEAVAKSFGSFAALSDVALAVPAGMFVSLLGPSGCGKTTLLRLIAGSIAPDRGRVLVDGEDVTAVATWRRNMGMVFQSFALFPHMTVAENVAFPLEVRAEPEAQRRTRVAEALAMVHLDRHAASYPRQLSGGQQQRVGLARAIVYRPRILLLDEPLSNLDASLREELRIEIGEVVRRLEITSVYVTHDQREALALSDRIAVMQAGRIVQFDTPEMIHHRPASAFVAGFVGYANTLPIEMEGGLGRLVQGPGLLRPADGRGISGRATAFIHASDVVLSPALSLGHEQGENRIPCRIAATAFMGNHTEYVLECASGLRLKAEAPVGASSLARGDQAIALLPADKLVIVSDEGAAAGAQPR